MVQWGWQGGQIDLPLRVPAGLGEFGGLAVTAGDGHSCVVLENLSPVCWGNNANQQLGDFTQTDSTLPVRPWGDALKGWPIESLSAGRNHTCALLDDGTVVCWGSNSDDQLGVDTDGLDSQGVVPLLGGVLAGRRFVGIDGGGAHTCSVLDNGEAACWGANASGQLGNGTIVPSAIPVAVSMAALGSRRIDMVAAGDLHSCALLDDGAVACWGYGGAGALGTGTTADVLAPQIIAGGALAGQTAVAVSAGAGHSCALLDTGDVACWGSDVSSSTPVLFDGGALAGRAVAGISSGSRHVCALAVDGMVACWGVNGSGQLGNGTSDDSLQPVEVSQSLSAGRSAVSVAAGGAHSCAVLDDGDVTCWGANPSGQLGDGTTTPSTTPVAVRKSALAGREIVDIASGGNHSCAALDNGSAVCWGSNAEGELGIGGSREYSAMPMLVESPLFVGRRIVRVAASQGFACALLDDGTAACWGDNDRGQLGTGSTSDSSVPVLVTGGAVAGKDIIAISAGYQHACAVLADGGAACWGLNDRGQLGNGTTSGIATSTPVQVVGGPLAGRDVVDVSAGVDHSCALLDDGSAACWGDNYFGALGDGTWGEGDEAYFSSTAVAVTATGTLLEGRQIESIDAGSAATCALLDDGSVTCWGFGATGELGAPVRYFSPVPVLASGGALVGRRARSVVTGANRTCAALDDGSTACWGSNGAGRLGDGTTQSTSTPVRVDMRGLAGGGASMVSADSETAVAIWSGVGAPGLPSSAPREVRALGVGRAVTVSWQRPSWSGAAAVQGYAVERSADAGRTWSPAATVGAVRSVSVTVPSDAFWTFRVRADTGSSLAAGAWASTNEVLVSTESRTTKSNVSATFLTPSGRPISGASIRWVSTDGKLESVGSVITNTAGAAIFPLLATGPVTFLLTAGAVGTTGSRLSTASLTTLVPRAATSITVTTPAEPSVATRSISVVMPDGSPVPDVLLAVSGGLAPTAETSTSTESRELSAAWTRLGWSSPLTSGPSGVREITGFVVPSNGIDVTATFSDGVLLQRGTASLTAPTVTVAFSQMPVVQMLTTEPSPLNPGGAATITVVAVDGTGEPIAGQALSLAAPVAAAAISAATDPVPAAAQCAQRLTGTSGVDGRVTFTVCPTSTKLWRADGSGVVASRPLRIPVKSAPTQLAAGGAHSCARLADGTARCWGSNRNGQLGNASTVGSTRPVAVSGLLGVSAVTAGASHSCAVLSAGTSGTVRCWGANGSGQLGDSTLTQRTTAVSVMLTSTAALSGVVRASAGTSFSCAVVNAGTSGMLYCWGDNAFGQLGDGSLGRRSRATRVKANSTSGLVGVTQVSAGNGSACAILATGAVRCWGRNTNGELGNGTRTNSSFPVPVSGIDGVAAKATSIAVGSGFACARLSTGAVRCWGRNDLGQLGNGGTLGSTRPVSVRLSSTTSLTDAAVVVAGSAHACVRVGTATTSRVRCWGSNSAGQVGDGSLTNRRYATLLSSILTGSTSMSAGGSHTLATIPSTLRPPTTATSWGLNTSGQLGNGTLANRATIGSIATL